MHSLSTFGAKMSHGQPRIHKTHHNPNFGEATTFPLIVFSVSFHGARIQMAFYNVNNCLFLNIILVYPNKNLFLKTINTIGDWKDAQYTCNALVEYIQNMVVDKFVQIYTENASNMWNTSNILKVHYPIIYFQGCATHCFDLLLND